MSKRLVPGTAEATPTADTLTGTWVPNTARGRWEYRVPGLSTPPVVYLPASASMDGLDEQTLIYEPSAEIKSAWDAYLAGDRSSAVQQRAKSGATTLDRAFDAAARGDANPQQEMLNLGPTSDELDYQADYAKGVFEGVKSQDKVADREAALREKWVKNRLEPFPLDALQGWQTVGGNDGQQGGKKAVAKPRAAYTGSQPKQASPGAATVAAGSASGGYGDEGDTLALGPDVPTKKAYLKLGNVTMDMAAYQRDRQLSLIEAELNKTLEGQAKLDAVDALRQQAEGGAQQANALRKQASMTEDADTRHRLLMQAEAVDQGSLDLMGEREKLDAKLFPSRIPTIIKNAEAGQYGTGEARDSLLRGQGIDPTTLSTYGPTTPGQTDSRIPNRNANRKDPSRLEAYAVTPRFARGGAVGDNPFAPQSAGFGPSASGEQKQQAAPAATTPVSVPNAPAPLTPPAPNPTPPTGAASPARPSPAVPSGGTAGGAAPVATSGGMASPAQAHPPSTGGGLLAALGPAPGTGMGQSQQGLSLAAQNEISQIQQNLQSQLASLEQQAGQITARREEALAALEQQRQQKAVEFQQQEQALYASLPLPERQYVMSLSRR